MDSFASTLGHVESFGYHKGDRTGTGTQSTFGLHTRFSLRNNNLPVVTGKFTHMHSVEHELFWMISGDTRVDYLIENGVRIWNEWVKPESAVYQILKHEGLFAKLEKRIGKDALFVFSAGQFKGSDDRFRIHSVDEYLKDLSDQGEESFWKQYPDMTQAEIDARKTIVEIDVIAWSKTLGGEWNPLPIYMHEDTAEEFAYRLHRLIFEAEPKVLIGGDLGAVNHIRNIELVQIINKIDWMEYESNGWVFVTDIPGNDHTTDKAVVSLTRDPLKELFKWLNTDETTKLFNLPTTLIHGHECQFRKNANGIIDLAVIGDVNEYVTMYALLLYCVADKAGMTAGHLVVTTDNVIDMIDASGTIEPIIDKFKTFFE